MAYIKKEFTYVGIDETGLPGRGQNIILVMAQTSNEKLAKEYAFGTFKKSADYLKEAKISKRENHSELSLDVSLPSLFEMKEKGLDCFYWMRSNNGRFSRQLLEHLSIAHMVTQTYSNLSDVVLLIDSFHNNPSIGRELISDCIKFKGGKIPKKNIVFGQGADKSIEIVSFADIIAYQICLGINNKYSKFSRDYLMKGKSKNEIHFDEKRIARFISSEERDRLEEIIARLQPRSSPRKRK